MSKNGVLSTGYEIVKASLKSIIYPSAYNSYESGVPVDSRFNLDPANYPNDEFGQTWHFWGDNFNIDVPITFNSYSNQTLAFRLCPTLSTVIKRKTMADLNGRRSITGNDGKETNSKYANKVRARLKQPNILQNWRNFRAQQKIYIQTYGFSILFATFPVGYEKYGLAEATSMWNIPPCLLNIKLTGKIFYQTDIRQVIEYIKIGDISLPLENIYIFRDNAAVSFSKVNIFPESRIVDLEKPISNIIAAYDSRNTLIRRRGALGILSPRAKDGTGAITIPLKPGEKSELQREWARYGTSSNQNNILISNAAVDWTRITMDVAELKLIEEVEESSMAVCDGYGFPPHLMGLLDPTFNNQLTAENGMYQNTIIPEAENDDATWNEAFLAEENGINISTDFSHLPILQAGAESKANARETLDKSLEREFKNNLITRNRWLELLGEPSMGKAGDVYFYQLVQQGISFGAIVPANGGQALNEVATPQGKNDIHIHIDKFNNSEPRDSSGRWTNGGDTSSDFIEGTEEERKALNIPPAWTNVKINKNKEADLLATGFDSKGRKQYIYSENATMRNAAAKFARNEEFVSKEASIVRQNEANMLSRDKSISEPATVMTVMHSTGIRPGSLKETGGKVKAYGATTLEGRHVIETPDGVRLQFVGKKGVNIDILVEDQKTASILLSRKYAAGDEGRLFNVTDSDLRDYTKTLDGGGFKPKDFRTLKASQIAMDAVSGMSRAANMAEYKKSVMSVAKKVSQALGNTPAIALKSYINPSIFLSIKP